MTELGDLADGLQRSEVESTHSSVGPGVLSRHPLNAQSLVRMRMAPSRFGSSSHLAWPAFLGDKRTRMHPSPESVFPGESFGRQESQWGQRMRKSHHPGCQPPPELRGSETPGGPREGRKESTCSRLRFPAALALEFSACALPYPAHPSPAII